MSERRDDRSPYVVAMERASRITTISLEMVLPALGGFWLDRRLGTGVVFLIVGALVGFAVAMWQLIRAARPPHSRL